MARRLTQPPNENGRHCQKSCGQDGRPKPIQKVVADLKGRVTSIQRKAGPVVLADCRRAKPG